VSWTVRLLLNSLVGCRGPVAHFGSADDYVIYRIIFEATAEPVAVYQVLPDPHRVAEGPKTALPKASEAVQ
jgi:hypothetical protein